MSGLILISSFILLASKGLAQEVILDNSTPTLFCYECDPQNQPDLCINPVQSGVSQTNCNEKFADREVNSTLVCLSTNVTYYGSEVNRSGIYRGCQVQGPAVTDICDWYKQETDNQNANLVACFGCNVTRCNNVTTLSDIGSNKASPLIRTVLIIGIVSFLFTTIF